LKPTVTFIIAAYNEERYLKECIDSCLAQNYPNIEVCVTDDGSTDQTWAILEQYTDTRVKKHRFAENRGKVAAFNQSYCMSSGDYFALIGADDVNCAHRISSQMDFLVDNRVDVTWGSYTQIDGDGHDLPEDMYVFNENPTQRDVLVDNCIPGNTVFFNRRVAEKVFPIPSQLLFEDWWIAFNTIYHYKFKFLNKPLIKYRLHDGNTVGNRKVGYVAIKRKNVRRHILYHDLFQSNLEDEGHKKFNLLVKNYKLSCLSDSLLERLSYLMKSLPYFSRENIAIFFKLLLVSIMGLKILSIFR